MELIKYIYPPNTLGPKDFVGEFCETFKEQIIYFIQVVPEIEKEKKLPGSFCEINLNLIPKVTRKEILRPFHL